ncbi:MAG: MarR family transcriptional regulator [Flavobacteriaceae bacterium]|jgi:DNA-binding MarR family transcriptional regulator|nr:MarR family transcriptional regulator [Flavobacteriaceae bacterium]
MESICEIKEVYKALYLFEKNFQDKNEITINEALVLCCLKYGETKTANEISGFIGLSNSRASRIINTVEKKNFIIRSMGAKDKRQMLFSLTEEGKRKIEEMKANEVTYKAFLEMINLQD